MHLFQSKLESQNAKKMKEQFFSSTHHNFVNFILMMELPQNVNFYTGVWKLCKMNVIYMEKNQVILTNVENFWDVSGLMCNIIEGER